MREPIEATVRWLAAATAPEARQALDEVKREAAALLHEAKGLYSKASRG